ncbi:VCBS repeat-containing protein [Flavobacteriaceae bacterium F89]|uniref:VCBS repeat-containing protein n=1 Tax=Cerina litoralis TaxID=2874477 RepID=A0AAE3EYB6_9FLAO|nr:VCBS repeat-containing protein [Cerina litoralis]MCG2462745.1 VCBS repeat-containing protein [Cerina litoralis]
MRGFSLFILAICLSLNACSNNEGKRFRKIPATDSGIVFKNELKDTPQLNILTYLYYYNGAGVAAADYNNDGLVDLYFTSNQGEDKLYLNKGNLKFEDVTGSANITNKGNWTTGVTHVDINNDGLLDIYVCKVGNYQGIKGENLLFVNQGIKSDGIPTFKEEAAKYGLDFSGFSTQAAFFDYDLDGDLDMYLMNHSVHPNRNNGKGSVRMEIDSLSGDRLYKNEGNKFVDVSANAGIYQGGIGYGLGLGVGDLNNDGYPDIYVGNDFFENDYCYINQKDGSFKEVISHDERIFGHTTHFSMGNDIADIDNDGYSDIVSLDMLPENLETYKTSGLEYPFATYEYYLKNGYAPQYMQNTLHLNLGNGNFAEIGNLSGISATEWSWGALLADFDNDGFKDLFVSNGIKGATNDMDFINFIANDNIQKRINQGMTQEDMAFIEEMPAKKVPNYFFENNGDLTFTDVTSSWFHKEDSFSNGCVYADLDNDGDLDLVVNNVDEVAYVLENTSERENNFLDLTIKGHANNRFGIGTKIIAYKGTSSVSADNFPTRGYLSAVPPSIHLGLGKDSILDSLKIIWPGGKYQTLKSVRTNRKITALYEEADRNIYLTPNKKSQNYLANSNATIPFTHIESSTVEFNRDPLVPFANTNAGPGISVGDINNDGLDDFFIGGAKRQASVLFVQDTNGSFLPYQPALFEADAVNEDVSQIFFDADGDGFMDLLVVSGGNEYRNGRQLRPRLYRNNKGFFVKDTVQFKGVIVNASKVGAVDFDNDGDLDVVITSDQVPWEFGKTPVQYLFKNDGNGNFRDATAQISRDFQKLGNVKDFVCVDLDQNGYKDVIAVGQWMPVTLFYNDGKTLTRRGNDGLDRSNGWWNTVVAEDFDNDGDVDLMVGNWGDNSKFKASERRPITLYRYDFDGNGTIEPLVTYFHGDRETPFASKEELTKQMPFLNKKYLSFKSFAKASLNDLFSEEKLQAADKKEVYILRSSYFENLGNGQFKRIDLPTMAQSSKVNDILVDDFNKDGFKDVLLVGNDYEISTHLGRMDAMHGIIFLNDRKGGFTWASNQNFDISGPARNAKKIRISDKPNLIIGINNSTPLLLREVGTDDSTTLETIKN